MLVFTIIGKELFILIFGAQWAEAGIYSQILSIWTFFVFLVSPLSNLTNVLGKNEISVLINVVKLITSIGAFMIGGRLGDARLALWLFSISGVITYAGYVLWATRASGVPLRKTISIFFSNVASSSPFLLAVLLFKVFNPVPEILLTKFNLPLQNIALLLFSAVVGVGYYVTAFKRDNTLREATNEVIHKLRNRENR